VVGAARMAAETGEHPALLREKVTSPGGTTIAALHTLENGRFRGLIMDAVDSACRRSKELSENRTPLILEKEVVQEKHEGKPIGSIVLISVSALCGLTGTSGLGSAIISLLS